MFEKAGLKSKINDCKKRIEELEKKRTRSEAALVTALLSGGVPNDDDVEYFNNFTAQIEEVRSQMHEYQRQLECLSHR